MYKVGVSWAEEENKEDSPDVISMLCLSSSKRLILSSKSFLI
jgi:hypothetical protein